MYKPVTQGTKSQQSVTSEGIALTNYHGNSSPYKGARQGKEPTNPYWHKRYFLVIDTSMITANKHTQTRSQAGSQSGAIGLQAILGILLIFVSAALIYTLFQQEMKEPQAPQALVNTAPQAIIARGDLAADEMATTQLFQQVSPSVVHITSLRKQRTSLSFDTTEVPQGEGSGFVWDTSGHIVTNYHVVSGADSAQVTLFDNTVWKAKVLPHAAPDKDLAVLKIEAPSSSLFPIGVGKSHPLLVGQKVFAIGYPFGLSLTLTTGIISGLGREIKSVTQRPIYNVIQTDAAINRGNSGGPLLDSAGLLIGVNTAIYNPSGAGTYVGVGFAVPVDTIRKIVPTVIAGKSGIARMGIAILSDMFAKRWGIRGVAIQEVYAGTPAFTAKLAGIRRRRSGALTLGDVIISFENKPVHSSGDLYRQLDNHLPGDTVSMEVTRDGTSRLVTLTLEALQ